MKRSLPVYFVWSSLLILALGSCRSSMYSSGGQPEMIRDSIFSDAFEKITLKTIVTYKEREISGLMMIKNDADGNYKIAFFNELGMTYLEGMLETSLKRKKLVVKNIAPIFNNKPFLKNFEKSLQTVLSDKINPCPHASMLPESDEYSLTVKLRNRFRLKLSPQITQIKINIR